VKSGSTADTAAGGPLDGVTVTIRDADKRIGTHVFVTAARARARTWDQPIKSLVFMMVYQTLNQFCGFEAQRYQCVGPRL